MASTAIREIVPVSVTDEECWISRPGGGGPIEEVVGKGGAGRSAGRGWWLVRVIENPADGLGLGDTLESEPPRSDLAKAAPPTRSITGKPSRVSSTMAVSVSTTPT